MPVVYFGGQDGILRHTCLPYLDIDISPSTAALNFRFEGTGLISVIILVENSNLDNFKNTPLWHAMSKAFPYQRIPQLKCVVASSVGITRFNAVLSRARKSN